MSPLITAAILAIPTFFVWACIHEFSHLIAYKLIADVQKWEMKLYPHMSPWGFRFAGVTVWCKPPIVGQWRAWMAPRIMDIVACVAFPFGLLFEGHAQAIWLVLWCGGLIDLFVGALGIGKNSDLRLAAKDKKADPWTFRLYSFVPIIISVGIFLTGVFKVGD